MSKSKKPTKPLSAVDAIASAMAVESALEKRRAAAKESDLKAQLRALEEQLEATRKVADFVGALRPLSRAIEIKPWKSRSLGATKRQATAFAVLSDTHIEETVDKLKVNGLNHYNPTIARMRMRRFFESILWLVREQAGMFEVRELLLAILGDIITGYIHEELVETNAMSPTRAVVFGAEIIGQGIQLLLEQSELKINIVCKCGNHGRTTQKIRVGTYVQNSYEWLLYHMLAEKFAAEPRVTFQIDEGLHSITSVYGMKVHTHHGDSVRSQGGIGGVDVPLNRAVLQWHAKYDADISVVGHFHTYQQGERCIRNGSMIGYGMYSSFLASALPEPPAQAFALIDSKRGFCQRTPLWVGDPSAEGWL